MTEGLVRAGEVYGDTPAAERDTAGFPGGPAHKKFGALVHHDAVKPDPSPWKSALL